jgi:hypothetical protein
LVESLFEPFFAIHFLFPSHTAIPVRSGKMIEIDPLWVVKNARNATKRIKASVAKAISRQPLCPL